MRFRRSSLGLACFAVLSTGTECIDIPGVTDKERKECEDVCAAEAQCDLGRSEADCLAALCDDKGFRSFDDAAAEENPDAGVGVAAAGDGDKVDLQQLDANDCMREADDCAQLALCSCGDACVRQDDCTGSPDPTCVDTCENLLEQDTALYLENRCKMESTCEDLAACGSVGGP